VSGAIGESAAVSAIHLGFSDYIHKDDISRLERAILKSIEIHQIRIESEKAAQELAVSEKRLSEFTEYLQGAIEHERAAIARDIHDDIGGSLAAAKLDLAWISRHSTDALTQSHIQAATEMLQHALGASQRIMMNLRPAILDQGLIAAVQWLTDGFAKRMGIPVSLTARQDTGLISKEKETRRISGNTGSTYQRIKACPMQVSARGYLRCGRGFDSGNQ